MVIVSTSRELDTGFSIRAPGVGVVVTGQKQNLPSPGCEAGLLPFGHDPSDSGC